MKGMVTDQLVINVFPGLGGVLRVLRRERRGVGLSGHLNTSTEKYIHLSSREVVADRDLSRWAG